MFSGLFSAMDEFELRKRARKVGAKGYIPKTFDENLLRARAKILEMKFVAASELRVASSKFPKSATQNP